VRKVETFLTRLDFIELVLEPLREGVPTLLGIACDLWGLDVVLPELGVRLFDKEAVIWPLVAVVAASAVGLVDDEDNFCLHPLRLGACGGPALGEVGDWGGLFLLALGREGDEGVPKIVI
jgi:hypothetical protein